jgi:hypothetical protein
MDAQCWEWPHSLRAQNWLMGSLVEPGWVRLIGGNKRFFPLLPVGKEPGTRTAFRGESSGAV